MNATQATAEVFWTAFRALPKREREAFLERLFSDQEFKEDLIDLAILEQRKGETSRTLSEYLAEREGKDS